MSSRLITEMASLEARAYLKKSNSYVGFELPPYINFDQLITFSSAYMNRKQLADVCKKDENGKQMRPSRFEDVNYAILSNKDGAYSWRPLKIIHPILYVDLVNLITNDENWGKLISRFGEYKKSYVECISMPRESLDEESDRAWQITNWWESIEQETLKEAFKFSYLATTDITDCYGSIYTHSFEWALDKDGREGAKSRKRLGQKSDGLGAAIDQKMQGFNSAQTNGIPQGSVLMDFLAEIVLGYADVLLTEKITSNKRLPRGSFRILRYRDDYRILADGPRTGNEILKQIDLVLYGLGLKMNPSKTKTSSDIISLTIKPEKMESIYVAPAYLNFQKRALRIFQISQKYPNTGIVMKELGMFYDDFVKYKKPNNRVNLEVILSIFVMIGINSPRTIHLVAGIVSKIFEKMNDIEKVKKLTRVIIEKFDGIPNASLLDIWLQRISAPLGIDNIYNDRFTHLAMREVENSTLWNNDWLEEDAVATINTADISDLQFLIEQDAISYVVEREEFELYKLGDYI